MNYLEEWKKFLVTGDEASKEVWRTVFTVPERDWALPPNVVKRPDGGYETLDVLDITQADTKAADCPK